ncbi:MAG TPA: APC family permease [Steroidobacteraceae bacterium]|nr:APC family permease [Steroidobacteraceae bacterium]
MTAQLRDRGLVRAVGLWGLTASIVNIIVGAGIFAVPAALAASVGPYAPLAFVACAAAIGAVAICFAEGGSRIPTSGGVYGCIEAAYGPLVGYIAGTLLWISDAFACGGVAAALADLAVSLVAPQGRAPAHALVIIGAIGGIAWVNIGGVARGVRFVNVATLLKLVPLAVFVIAGTTAIHSSNYLPTAAPTTAGLGRALILAMFALTGMEASLIASGEVAQPARTIPRALALAILIVTLLYVAIQAIAQGVLGASLAQSTVPLADAMAQISPTLRALMLVGAGASMFGWLGSDLLGSPRMLFAFARDGRLPRVLGRVDPRTHAPHVAILAYAILAITLALTGTFAELAVLATLAVAVVYGAGCAAAWRLARRDVALAGAPLNFRWLRAAMLVGIGSMAVLIALASREEIVGLAIAIAGSVLAFWLSKQRLPAQG